MPSSWHDAIVQIFSDEPRLALQVLGEWAGTDIPAGLPARLESPVFNDRPSADFAADVVVSAGPQERPAQVVIVEAQRRKNVDKLRQWPRYAAATWLMLECPVHVLVICSS